MPFIFTFMAFRYRDTAGGLVNLLWEKVSYTLKLIIISSVYGYGANRLE